ncbi:hypothetical protein C8J57DRAFT_1492828 [Mycena rebaudengoi]|nr:hypothetical protein C8J57DRAFT_1492828 [Mycena rebaudengoi]
MVGTSYNGFSELSNNPRPEVPFDCSGSTSRAGTLNTMGCAEAVIGKLRWEKVSTKLQESEEIRVLFQVVDKGSWEAWTTLSEAPGSWTANDEDTAVPSSSEVWTKARAANIDIFQCCICFSTPNKPVMPIYFATTIIAEIWAFVGHSELLLHVQSAYL